ncbi:MAG: HDOD domain-containing protein [Halothiobacillus sp.]
MWHWLTALWAPKKTHSVTHGAPALKSSGDPVEPQPAPQFPSAEQVSLSFYQKLLNAPAHLPNVADQLSAEEACWLNDRTEDLKQTPTQLTKLVPRLPSVLPKLMTALNDSDTPIRTLTELIESDPIISTQVLRLTNSPAMRVRRENITSLEQAVMLLGFSGMREVVSAAMFSPISQLNQIEGVHPLLIHDIWPVSLRAANALRQGLKYEAAHSQNQQAAEIDASLGFELYLSLLIEHTGLIALIRQKPLTGATVSATYLTQFRALVPAYSARIAEAWALSTNTIELMRNPPPALNARREEARYFSMACALNRRGYLDQAQFLHLCRALPAHTNGWYTQCVPAGDGQEAD